MLVELIEVSGPLDKPVGPVQVNPRHVVLVRRGVNASDPDAQAFTSELTLEGIGPLKVQGATSEIRQKLNLASVR